MIMKKEKTMLTVKQRNLLIASFVCYILVFLVYFLLKPWMFIAPLIASSVLMLLFSYSVVTERTDTEGEVDDLNDRIVSVKREWRMDTERLKEELSEQERAVTVLQEELTAANIRNSELVDKIETLELVVSQETTPSFSEDKDEEVDMSSVLPQYLPQRSESTTVNIIDVAKSVAKELHDDAVKAGLTIQISSSEDSLLVKGDQNLLRILFRNIVDNSIKYMNRHGSLIITVSSIGDDIFVVCKDTGEGLSSDETEHIFELNYQGSNRISGNGLGLFQAKAIVNFYGGTIYAKSRPGSGMGIYIQIPTM